MPLWLLIPILLAAFYLAATLVLTYLVQQHPRRPVHDPPDWGTVEDFRVPAADGGSIEVWRVVPERSNGWTAVFVHGWGRNRDRMVNRARIFGSWGFVTVLFSARDHGGSSPRRFMNAVRFAEDIEAVLAATTFGPVVLYGHSMGSAGAVIAAGRRPDPVNLLVLEGVYAHTGEALLSLYRWFHPLFGLLFGRMIVFWMSLFYRGLPNAVSPERLAGRIRVPVLIVHGARDRRFPVSFARRLQAAFPAGSARLVVVEGAGHSDSSRLPDYLPALRDFLETHLGERLSEGSIERSGGGNR